MADFVLDASVALAWFLAEQATHKADDLLNRSLALSFAAPRHLALEFRSGLLKAERLRRVDAPRSDTALAVFSSLDIQLFDHGSDLRLQAAWRLARAYRLSFYDALYLDLAARSGDVLASCDGALLAAADSMGLATYDARMN